MLRKSLIASAVALVGTFSAQAQLSLLSDTRDQIVFPEYTAEEKQRLVTQAQLVLDGLYVNKYAKDLYYGTSPNPIIGHLSPVEAVNKVAAEVDTLSSAELNKRLGDIFRSQRDLHLSFSHPQPFANYDTFLPFVFAKTVDASGNNEVRISNVWSNFTNILPNTRFPEVGDKLVSYDGFSALDAVSRHYNEGSGANAEAGFVRALSAMRYKSHTRLALPENDNIELEFLSQATGETYKVVFPWFAWNKNPTRAAQEQADNANIEALGQESTNFELVDSQNLQAALDINDANAIATIPSSEPTISWNIREVDGKSIGYIKISSFSPARGTNAGVTAMINLLDNQLAGTDSLIVDVRDNPGGNIPYADSLVQLFSPHIVNPTELRFTNTPLNQHLMQNTIFRVFGENWVKVLTDVDGTDAQYTATSTYVSVDENNQFGQVYYKPVGVWSNANTYSSGDVFTCGVQDNGSATVYGSHKTTGAGGANVLSHSLFARFGGAGLEAMPYGQDVTISWRQMVRHGHHKNSIIEDFGCVADVNVPYTLSDMLDSGASDFNEIARDLIAKAPAKSTVSFEAPKTVSMSDIRGRFTFDVTNTEYVDVYVNNVKVERINAFAYGSTPKTISYDLPGDITPNTVQFIGLDAGKARLWNSKRYIN